MLCFQEIEINPSLHLMCTKAVVKRNITQTRNFVHLQCNHKNKFGLFDMYYNLEYGFPSVGSSQYPINIFCFIRCVQIVKNQLAYLQNDAKNCNIINLLLWASAPRRFIVL